LSLVQITNIHIISSFLLNLWNHFELISCMVQGQPEISQPELGSSLSWDFPLLFSACGCSELFPLAHWNRKIVFFPSGDLAWRRLRLFLSFRDFFKYFPMFDSLTWNFWANGCSLQIDILANSKVIRLSVSTCLNFVNLNFYLHLITSKIENVALIYWPFC
jgi:hypothetical protein